MAASCCVRAALSRWYRRQTPTRRDMKIRTVISVLAASLLKVYAFLLYGGTHCLRMTFCGMMRTTRS